MMTTKTTFAYCHSNLKVTSSGLESCGDQWTSLSTGCYHFITGPVNWQSAKGQCEEMNGQLVQIETEEENAVVLTEALKMTGVKEVWIGLSDFGNTGNWVWNFGDEITYSNWNQGEPNGDEENCGMMNTNHPDQPSGKWNDVRCTNEFATGAICESGDLLSLFCCFSNIVLSVPHHNG